VTYKPANSKAALLKPRILELGGRSENR